MARIILTSSGSYPRIGEGEPGQRLRKAYTEFEQGQRTGAELQEIEGELTSEVISLQVRAGLELVTDGQIGWYDPISHFLGKTEGVEIDGLSRFFDTNFYYRQPIIMGKVKWKAPILLDEFLFAKSVSPLPVKPVITGAYTLGRLSVDRYYNDFSKLLDDIAEVIAREVELLAQEGAEIIQIDEPAISTRIEEMDFARNAMRIVTQGLNAYFVCHICYGDFAPVYKHMLSLEVDNLDLETSLKTSVLKAFLETNVFDKDVSYGVLDVHSHLIEGTEEVKGRIKQALSLFDSKALWIDPDCGLKTRLQDEAVAKLENMVKAVRQLRQN